MDLILPDQPNRRIRTRLYGGVGGALSDGRPYPDMNYFMGFPVFGSINFMMPFEYCSLNSSSDNMRPFLELHLGQALDSVFTSLTLSQS